MRVRHYFIAEAFSHKKDKSSPVQASKHFDTTCSWTSLDTPSSRTTYGAEIADRDASKTAYGCIIMLQGA